MMMRKTILLTLVLAASSGCVSHLSPYKMDIRQGNFITQEMRDKLKLGMSKQQVRYVMGTPLVSDAFHGNRWDYSYTLMKRGTVMEKQLMTLYFDGENLARIDENGQSQIASAPAVSPAAEAASEVSVAPVVAAMPVVANNNAVDNEVAVKASVKQWAERWSARDTEHYLAAYAETFAPADMDHAAWKKLRTSRLESAQTIHITLREMRVQTQDANHATVHFVQIYRADNYHDKVRKVLQLEKVGAVWLIVSEKIEQ